MTQEGRVTENGITYRFSSAWIQELESEEHWRLYWRQQKLMEGRIHGGDAFDLDACAARESRHLDGRARRRRMSWEVFGVDFVDGGEIVEIHKVDRRFQDAFESRAGRIEHRLEVFHHLMRL